MYEQVEKPKERKSRTVANSVSQKKSNGKQGFGFVDNRPEAVTQKQLVIQRRDILSSGRYTEGFKANHVKNGMPDDKECIVKFEERNVANNTIIDQNSCKSQWKTTEQITAVNNTKPHSLKAQGVDVSKQGEDYRMQNVQSVVVMRANGQINHMDSIVPVGQERIITPPRA